MQIPSFEELQAKIKEYINVLKMARKADRDEFLSTTKISVAVMFLVGLIGFIIYILMEILPGVFKE
jgi:protein transport protein SEC61 subunit gamma-like protein